MVTTELKEKLLEEYRNLYDLNLTYIKLRISEEDQKTLNADTAFQARIKYLLIEKRERLFESLESLMVGSNNDSVRLKATMELGRMLHPSRFIEGVVEDEDGHQTKDLGTVTVNHQGELKVTDELITRTASVFRILEESGALKSRAVSDDDTEDDEVQSS